VTLDHKVKGLTIQFYLFKSALLFCAIFSKIGQAIQNLLQTEIFGLYFLPLTLRSSLQPFYLFKSAILVYYIVQFLAKSIMPLRIYNKFKYLTFENDL